MENNLKVFVARSPAKKIRITDINSGKFFSGSKEEMKPPYIITPFGEKVSRVNVIGTVVEKFESVDKPFASVTVDDGSDAIRVKAFQEEVEKLRNVKHGQFVNIIGKVKNYNGETYITSEIVKEVSDLNFENMRNLEILKELAVRKKIVNEIRDLRDSMSDEELEVYAKEKYGMDDEIIETVLEGRSVESDYKPKVLELIEKMDDGSGVGIGKIFESLNLDENIVENVISDLLSSGLVYEPVVGKLKKV